MRLACIGIGSNAIRLLEAEWKEGRLCALRRERCGTRLFAGLVNGMLTQESVGASEKRPGVYRTGGSVGAGKGRNRQR